MLLNTYKDSLFSTAKLDIYYYDEINLNSDSDINLPLLTTRNEETSKNTLFFCLDSKSIFAEFNRPKLYETIYDYSDNFLISSNISSNLISSL